MLRILLMSSTQRTLNLNPLNKCGWSPTHFAAKSGNCGVIRLLHSLNLELAYHRARERFDLSMEGGALSYTPLHLTVFSSFVHCSEELIRSGEADLFKRNKDFFRPIDLTRGNLITYKIMKKGERDFFRRFFGPVPSKRVYEKDLVSYELVSNALHR